jgi:hypothetical protein
MFRPQELTREQFERYLLIARGIFISNEDSLLQHKAGMLDEAAHATQTAGLRRMLTMWPGLRALWRLMSAQYGADFRRHMDEIVMETRHQSAPDLFADWQALVREELGASAPPPS